MKRIPRALLMTTLPLLAGVPQAQGVPAVTIPKLPDRQAALTSSGKDTRTTEAALLHAAPTMRPAALQAALAAWNDLHARGEVSRSILTVIDYGLPSITKRMWVFDMDSRRLLFHELVAHGRNSGEDVARWFSNKDGSRMTSLGAFITGGTYIGRNGYSMRLHGMEPGLNDHAEARTIVVHGAPYVCEETAHKLGRIGRSYGCPAVRPAIARALIDQVKDRTLLYAWHPLLLKPATPAVVAPALSDPGPLDVRPARGR